MDATKSIRTMAMKLAASRRVRAFAIAVLVLAVLAVLQVQNLKRNTPMTALLSSTTLCQTDLQRMQIALSQSGLRDYKVKDNCLLVPTDQHSEYLQAIANLDAIPDELRDNDQSERPSINPFLSRSQQLSNERAEKKRQIRDMVLRLPFVEQAWFEMDKSDSHSAFEEAEQSAVISIRTPQNIPLSDQNADTVKKMIGGAVAGLNSQNIVVIDLGSGFAHQNLLDPSTTRQVHFRRIAFEQQRFYEDQIRELLKDYPGIGVSVFVDVKPAPKNKTAAAARNLQPKIALIPAQLPTVGANSYATIESFNTPTKLPEIKLASTFDSDQQSAEESLARQISVSIDVPQSLVHQLFGAPTVSKLTTNRVNARAAMANDTQSKFEKLQSEIIAKISPVLPRSSFENGTVSPIAINLIREPMAAATKWPTQLKEFALQNWPSAAVLIIGLMLLSIVTRKPEHFVSPHDTHDENADIVSINSRSNEPVSGSNPEVRLTQLIEKDPDAAAKVIQAWIRDAA